MINLFLFLISLLSLFTGTITQENAQGKLSDALLECYNNTYGLSQENRLPNNIHSFIAIVRKIEENPLLNMDLRQLSVALLHRFRQDGIVIEPLVDPQPGVTPYALNGFQFYRHSEMLKLIPGNAKTFPNSSINHIERCSLHSMLSSTIDTFQRGDESSTCKIINNNNNNNNLLMRIEKSLLLSTDFAESDAETLSSEQILPKRTNKETDDFDPDKWYHDQDNNGHLEQTPTSQCPSEGGVFNTEWGVVSGGPILAGISAALQPQNVKISDLIVRQKWPAAAAAAARDSVTLRDDDDDNLTLDNKWIATLAGDLLEVALRQGPRNNIYKINSQGHFNSSLIPKHYYLNDDQGLELTAAELRGDIDGLILANQVSLLYAKVSSIKLSQLLDMYYSDRGVLNSTIRACNRIKLFPTVAINETIWTQTFRAALVLCGNPHLTFGTISPENIEKYSIQATNKLLEIISSSNNDENCPSSQSIENIIVYNRLAIDLTIFLDTKWPFNLIKPILHFLMEKSDINRYASNFTLVNALNGQIIINKTHSILDIYNLNETQYNQLTRGFDLPKSLDVLKIIQTDKLNHQRDWNIGGGQTDIVLIIPYSQTSLTDADKEYSLEKLTRMRIDSPDTRIIFLTGGTKDRWSSLVVDASNDVYSVGSGTTREIPGPIDALVNRMKRLERRLFNSQCGADWQASSDTTSASHTDYVEPMGINFYRLHQNYFFKRDDDYLAMIKIQGNSTSGGGTLKICNSRQVLNVNNTGTLCTTIDAASSHTMTFGCSGASNIDNCSPFFISIFANTTTSLNSNYQCTDWKVCRYPDMIKYTISYDNLICTNSGHSISLSSTIIIITFFFFFFFTTFIFFFNY